MANIFDLGDDWTESGTVYDAIKIDVTDTASDATSKLLDLQIGGTSKFKVDKGGNVTLAGSITGLDQVDNTSDLDKPVSTLQATAIGVVQTDVDNHEALTNNPHAVTSAQVGLGNVDNTSDLDKPVSTLTQAAIDAAGGGAFGADANTLITASTPIVLDQATGDEAALTLDYTTNKAAGNDTGLLINQTDTLSPGTSKFIDAQVGGASKFSVDKAGNVSTGPSLTINNASITDAGGGQIKLGSSYYFSSAAFISATPIAFGPNWYTSDLVLARDAANTLGQRNGTDAQTFNIYNTYTNATDYERGHIGWNDTADTFVIGTEAAGSGAARSMSLLSDFGAILGLGNGAVDWQIISSNIRPAMDNVRDLGQTSRRLKNVFIGTTLDIAQGTLTDDTQALNITSTWNDAADTFTLIKADVTDTASAAGSKLLDLQVGGTSKASIEKDGDLALGKDLIVGRNGTISAAGGGTRLVLSPSTSVGGVLGVGVQGTQVRASDYLGWSSTQDPGYIANVRLYSGGAGILEQRNGVNAQTSNIYNTYTDANNYERAHIGWDADTFVIGTEAGSGGGTARDIAVKGVNYTLTFETSKLSYKTNAGALQWSLDPSRIWGQSNSYAIQNPKSTLSLGAWNPARGNYDAYLDNTAAVQLRVAGNMVAEATAGQFSVAGNVGIGTTTPTVALDVSGSIAATGTVKTTPTTVGALPAAATAGAGARTFVTDSANSLSSHHGQAVTGGGTDFVPVYSDGTTWRVG